MDYDYLDKLLKSRKISRRKLALAVGINENKMSTAFRRKSGLSTTDTVRIADFLGIDIHDLVGIPNPNKDKKGSGAIMDLTFNEYQALAMRTKNKSLSPDANLHNAMLGLAGETGECCDLVKKCFYQDGRDIREKLFDELSDVLWYAALAADSMGFSLGDIAAHNIEKLRKRYPDGFDPNRSLHRQTEGEA